ncbi:MAG: T9SS type A sorting domain-containing protein [Bacteroidia bacterium]|nr:T9SS type A sorting domain-containing protein [Bacteroidia bacterium]
MRKILVLITAITCSLNVFSQRVTCGTDGYHKDLIERHPAYQTAYEEYLKELTAVAQQDVKASHGKKAVVTIPVVFHVIHEYGPENISKAQILDQMRTLNEDFRRLNADTTNTRDIFKSIAVDTEIEFKLATKDEDGNCTDGITRTVSPLTNGGDEQVKDLINWDYRKYLNVWVINHVGRAGANGGIVAGYSRFPFQTSAAEDGIVINHSFVGSIGTSDATRAGRTLTHEVGHWLGLRHPFQDSGVNPDCGTSNCQTSGDRVCDTPPVLEASFGCPGETNSCTIDSPDRPDQTENYMDYADGRCTNMFTAGQKSVMDFYLGRNEYRGQNVSASAASATGINISNPCAPKADFHVVSRNTTICQKASIEFEDLSWNGDVVDRIWTFEGGSPSSSTFPNPTVAYNTSGKFKVTLKVTNSKGSTEISKTEFITVNKEVADLSSPFIETFESPYSEFTWNKEYDGEFGWQRLDNEGHGGGFASVCAINSETPVNAQYSLISPNFDLSLHKDLSPILSFRAAYSMRATGSAGERLVIYGSDDCGNSWRVLRSLIGITTLKSVDGNNPGWRPNSPADWKLHAIDLAQYGFENSTSLVLRFEVTSNAGNSIFLDDVNVDRNVLSTRELAESLHAFSLVPNPSSGKFEVRLSNVFEPIHIEVLDILGQKLQTLDSKPSGNGEIQHPIWLNESGIYFVRIKGSTIDSTKRIIVSD